MVSSTHQEIKHLLQNISESVDIYALYSLQTSWVVYREHYYSNTKAQCTRAKTNTHINFTYYTFIKYLSIMPYDLILTCATQVSSQNH